jgi:hypothetical protein
MKNSIRLEGRTDPKLRFYNESEFDDFVNRNPYKTAIIEITLYEQKSCHAYIGFYRNKLLPDIQQAMYEKGDLMLLDSIDKKLRSLCPTTVNEIYDENSRTYKYELIDLEDLEKWQLTVFIDKFLYKYCAENLDIIIDRTVNL